MAQKETYGIIVIVKEAFESSLMTKRVNEVLSE